MESLEEKRRKTEGCNVKVVQEGELTKILNVSAVVINAVGRGNTNKVPTGRDPIDATDAATIGKDGTFAIDVHGPKRLETTETTQEMNDRLAEEEKRIADMPSPKDDFDIRSESNGRNDSDAR